MTIGDLELPVNMSSTDYGPLSYGNMAGNPTVELALSKSDQRKQGVQALDRQFAAWGWKKKLSSGRARLRFTGNTVLADRTDEAMATLNRLLDARFVDMEIKEDQITSYPNRDIKNMVDYYSIFVPLDKDFDEDVFEHFVEQSNNYGDVEFLFEAKTETDAKDAKNIVREYSIYDHDVWLYATGRKARNTSERMERLSAISNRHNWNFSPRMDIMMDAHKEFEDE